MTCEISLDMKTNVVQHVPKDHSCDSHDSCEHSNIENIKFKVHMKKENALIVAVEFCPRSECQS